MSKDFTDSKALLPKIAAESDIPSLIVEPPSEDDLTKQIADSILNQNLSPTGSVSDDLGQDNINALASSLSANDLKSLSQVLNSSLLNSAVSGDLNSMILPTSTSQQRLLMTPVVTQPTICQPQTSFPAYSQSLQTTLVSGSTAYGSTVSQGRQAYDVQNTQSASSANIQHVQDTVAASPGSLGFLPQSAQPHNNAVVNAAMPVVPPQPNLLQAATTVPNLTASNKLAAVPVSFLGNQAAPASQSFDSGSLVALENILQVSLDPNSGSNSLLMAQANNSGVRQGIAPGMAMHDSSPSSSVPTPSVPQVSWGAVPSVVNKTPEPKSAATRTLRPISLQNGLPPTQGLLPSTAPSISLPLGLKFACPLQTILPQGLLAAGLTTGQNQMLGTPSASALAQSIVSITTSVTPTVQTPAPSANS